MLSADADSHPVQGQQGPLAQQTLCGVRPADELAQGLGEELGFGAALL
jgi:hypothetical protein